MSRDGWIHGSAVDKETRECRYFSPSALQLADYSTSQGCLKKWYYAYVLGMREPETRPQREGTADHAVVERYLLTGERIFSPRVAKGLHMLPPAGDPRLNIEWDMTPFQWTACKKKHAHTYDCPPCAPDHKHDDKCKKVSGLHLSTLHADGVPISGRIDLLHDLGVNYGAESVDHMQDPEGTVEVFDHKFTKSLDYAKSGRDLLKTIQMVAYGEYVYRTFANVSKVRLSHGYYPTSGPAKKSTVLTDREPLSRFWSEHVEPLARSIRDVAKEPTVDTVPGNPKACRAFGKECAHAPICNAGPRANQGNQTLSSFLGKTASEALISTDNLTKKTDTMGLTILQKIQKPAAPAQADASAKAAELAKLKTEEAEAKRKALVPADFAHLMASIEAHGRGMPQINGAAAKVYAAWKGYDDAANGYAGSGDLAEVVADSVDMLRQIASELDQLAQEAPPESVQVDDVAPALMPDDTPPVASTPVVTDVGAAPSEPAPPAPPVTSQGPVEKPKKERASKKAKADAAPAETTDATPPATVAPAPTTNAVSLYVDTLVEGGGVADLAVTIDRMIDDLAKRAGLDDLRLAGQDNPLGYGKWKGALAAFMREAHAAGHIPPGAYKIDVRGNEIYEEAVQALRKIVRDTGGVFVRGLR